MGLLSRAALVAALAAASLPSARADDGEAAAERPFWDWLLAPHAAEVDAVQQKVREQRAAIHNNALPDFDPSSAMWSPSNAESRARLWDDLEAMLRYALRLAPDDLELRRDLALVLADADEAGAEAALTAYLDRELPERPTGDARLRLAILQARRGELPAAAAQLRQALGSGFLEPRGRTTAALVLAQVYMADGRMAEAIDLLETAAADGPAFGYGGAIQLSFALAVAYDRDEQLSRAHEILERIALAGSEQLLNALADPYGNGVTFVPASERLYWSALQLEALGHLGEAQGEWRAYARAPGARFASRARAHAAALDRLLDERADAARQARPRRLPPTPSMDATTSTP